MARLPTGRASTTGLAGARVLFRRLQAQGSARRSRQSGRVVTTAVYLSLGAIQRKALPTKPTGSGIQQNPAYGLVDNASFLFFQNPRHRPLGILRKVQGPPLRRRAPCGPRAKRSLCSHNQKSAFSMENPTETRANNEPCVMCRGKFIDGKLGQLPRVGGFANFCWRRFGRIPARRQRTPKSRASLASQ